MFSVGDLCFPPAGWEVCGGVANTQPKERLELYFQVQLPDGSQTNGSSSGAWWLEGQGMKAFPAPPPFLIPSVSTAPTRLEGSNTTEGGRRTGRPFAGIVRGKMLNGIAMQIYYTLRL